MLGPFPAPAVEEEPGYPGWQPDTSSRLLAVVRAVQERVCGPDERVKIDSVGRFYSLPTHTLQELARD